MRTTRRLRLRKHGEPAGHVAGYSGLVTRRHRTVVILCSAVIVSDAGPLCGFVRKPARQGANRPLDLCVQPFQHTRRVGSR